MKMRTEQEMFDLILTTAKEDEKIRAVYMNGSRTNKYAIKDIFQDYDIVYVVTDTKPFYEDKNWIYKFGEPLYMQMPEKMDLLVGKPCNLEESFGWLVIFQDGNRIDLHVNSIAFAKKTMKEDRLCQVLLDKDGLFSSVEKATDEQYYVKRPTKQEFACQCNEFWWCLNNVAKGLWREEVPYAMDMLNFYVRPCLVMMLSWQAGIMTNFSCSVGKSGKYLYRYLPKELYEGLLKTYSDSTIEHIWQSVFVMCDLFAKVARSVGKALSYPYEEKEEDGARFYLQQVYHLPKDATNVFL